MWHPGRGHDLAYGGSEGAGLRRTLNTTSSHGPNIPSSPRGSCNCLLNPTATATRPGSPIVAMHFGCTPYMIGPTVFDDRALENRTPFPSDRHADWRREADAP